MFAKSCPVCHNTNMRNYPYCWKCGRKNPHYKIMPPKLRKICPQCKKKVKLHWNFCARCGYDLKKRGKRVFEKIVILPPPKLFNAKTPPEVRDMEFKDKSPMKFEPSHR